MSRTERKGCVMRSAIVCLLIAGALPPRFKLMFSASLPGAQHVWTSEWAKVESAVLPRLPVMV